MRELKIDEMEAVSGGRVMDTIVVTVPRSSSAAVSRNSLRGHYAKAPSERYLEGTHNPTYGAYHIPGSIQSDGQMGYAGTIITVKGSDDEDEDDNHNADLNVTDSSNDLLHLTGIPGGGSNSDPRPDENGVSIAAITVDLGPAGISGSVGYEINGDQDLWVSIDASKDFQLTPKILSEMLSKFKSGVGVGVTVPIDGNSLGNNDDIKIDGQISGNLFGVSVSTSGSVGGSIGDAQLGASISAGASLSINITDVAASMAMSVDQLISHLENATNDTFRDPSVDDDGNLDHGIIDDLNNMIPHRFNL